ERHDHHSRCSLDPQDSHTTLQAPPPGWPRYGLGESMPEQSGVYPQLLPDPPYGYATDPRQEPRWVYAPHDSRDEIREMPYFNCYPGPPAKPRRRGPPSAILFGAGVLGAAILLIGLLSQLFHWDNHSNPLQDLSSPSPSTPHVIP